MFPRLCFKYLTTVPPPTPSLSQIPRPGCRRGTRAHCGAERGAKGAGGGRPGPLGTLLFRQVDSAIWVTGAEAWGRVQRIGREGRGLSSKNRNMGTLGVNRSVSKAEASAEHQPPWPPAGREPARSDAWFQPLLVLSESACHSDTLKSVAFPCKPTGTRGKGKGCGILPKVWGPRGHSRKAATLGFLYPQFSGCQVLGTGPRGNQTFPDLAPPSQG